MLCLTLDQKRALKSEIDLFLNSLKVGYTLWLSGGSAGDLRFFIISIEAIRTNLAKALSRASKSLHNPTARFDLFFGLTGQL